MGKLQWTEIEPSDTSKALTPYLIIEAIRKVAEQIHLGNQLLDALVTRSLDEHFEESGPTGVGASDDDTNADLQDRVEKIQTNQTVHFSEKDSERIRRFTAKTCPECRDMTGGHDDICSRKKVVS